jgi:hypothetical protein
MLSERFADDASEMSSVGRHGGRGALAHARAERIARSQTLVAMSTDTRWVAMRRSWCCCCVGVGGACVHHRWVPADAVAVRFSAQLQYGLVAQPRPPQGRDALLRSTHSLSPIAARATVVRDRVLGVTPRRDNGIDVTVHGVSPPAVPGFGVERCVVLPNHVHALIDVDTLVRAVAEGTSMKSSLSGSWKNPMLQCLNPLVLAHPGRFFADCTWARILPSSACVCREMQHSSVRASLRRQRSSRTCGTQILLSSLGLL